MEYALMALKHMAERPSGRVTSAKEIVDLTGAPFDATARVMQLMAQAGLLKSEQGAYGGYKIKKDLNQVSLKDLLEVIQGRIEVVKCACEPNEEVDCSLLASCNIQMPMREFNQQLQDFYSQLSVGQLLKVQTPALGSVDELREGKQDERI